jgi:hypothetical protein
MQQQQTPSQGNNNMITSIDKIPLKTSGISKTDDMDDPMVKDVLNEFENELSIQQNNYQINNQPIISTSQQQQQQQQQQPIQNTQMPTPVKTKKQKINYIDNILINKTFIICIIIAIVINPYIFNTILSKIPDNISSIVNDNNYIIKLLIIFIILYIMMFYNIL